MAKNYTIFQNLEKAITGNWAPDITPHINSYDMSNSDHSVIFRTKNKDEYETKKLELRQNKYLKDRWIKANVDMSVTAYAGLNNVKLMYRDADLMDGFPEIGAALDIVSEESCLNNDKNSVINVYSNSERIKSILEDLFVNRLNLQITAPMIIRGMCKYGNQFMLLDIDKKMGVKDWKQLPVFNVERIENGIMNPYGTAMAISTNDPDKVDMSTKFIWLDENNSQVPFRSWQIAHFRLLTNSMYLPYGVSYLNAARRHWRMLSLMEDMMLIYRLERSIERRVYKIYVGAIDDADVQAYVENIANNFKRTPIIDPMTGQIDLRKNILPVRKDTPIPLLDGRTITIEQLANEFNEGKENYVYSVQDKTHKIVPGKVVWCGKNYTAEKLIKVTLDDGSYMVMAPEHEIIMRDGSKKRADEVVSGESVMPFYRKVDKESKKLFDRYEKVYNPYSGKYEFTHRLIAENVDKTNDSFNTVHHKDFDKYNNNPTNLLWMDYFEHHKMHGDLARKNWNDPEKRKLHIQHLSEACMGRRLDEATKEKISNTLKAKYASGELDYVKENSSRSITEYNKSEKAIEKNRRLGKERGYRLEFEAYNHSELHKQHDAIRREAAKKSWEGEGRTNRVKKMTTYFDNYVWDTLRNNILNHVIINRKTMLDFINNNLIDYLIKINNSEKLEHNRKITRGLLQARLKEIGFATITDYVTSMLKNHKIVSTETINGDDVYCMTVVGLNGEDDRHNFALRTFNEDGSWHENGCFVSNCVDQDLFIPVRDQSAPTPIDTLAPAQNLTAMDDIKYVQNKVCTALRIPKTFLNFEEAQGDGKNLALEDIRFTRTVNRIQQAFLMELTKVASIHLYLLGFTDDLTNFSLTMNNPSTQAEQLEIDNLEKKITACRDAISDPGNGIPVMSQTRALKEIMKWSDKDIKENLEEIRLEKGLAAELEKTSQIIKRTGIFDQVDRIYGDPGAEYSDDQQQQGGPDGMGGGGAPMGGGGGDFGAGLDAMGSDEGGADLQGNEGTEPTSDMAGGTPPEGGGGEENTSPVESRNSNKPLITEKRQRIRKAYNNMLKESEAKADVLFKKYLEKLNESDNIKKNENSIDKADVYDKSLMINEEFDKMIKGLENKINE